MTTAIPSSFTSAKHLFASFGILPPSPREDWRLLPENERRFGQIHGIPNLSGKAWATNGILIAIVSGDTLKLGHYDWFEPDARLVVRQHGARETKNAKRIQIEYV